MITCFSKYYFGVECPGCGAQRSAIKLLNGEILDSIALYPALIPFFLLCIVGGMSLFKVFKIDLKWVVILAISNVLIMLTQYILKMMGCAPWFEHANACFQS